MLITAGLGVVVFIFVIVALVLVFYLIYRLQSVVV